MTYRLAACFVLSLLAQPAAAQTPAGQQGDTLTTAEDSLKTPATQPAGNTKPGTNRESGLIRWFEQHPVVGPGIFVIVAALIGLLGVYLSNRKKKTTERGQPGEKGILEDYLDSVRKQNGYLQLLGFVSTANIDVLLLDAFLPLRLQEHFSGGKLSQKADGSESEKVLQPEHIMHRAEELDKTLLILGIPGSGKTTLLKYFAVRCSERKHWKKSGLRRRLIPLLVPLR